MNENSGAKLPAIEWRGRGGGMLVRAMLAQNVGTGCAFGGLGVSVLALQERFDSSLGTATMGLSLVVLLMTALGPLLAGLIARWGIRAVMATGVLLSLMGYLALAFAPTMPIALAACGLLIGPGAALFAALPPAVLASAWFPHVQGRVMGFVYLPLFITVIPLLGVNVIQNFGLTSFYLSLAALHLLLFPLMLGVQAPTTDGSAKARTEDVPVAGIANKVILGSAVFWVIAFGDGVLNGTAIAGASHVLPIVTEYGVSMETGAILLAISGAASILGALISGFACDYIGSARTLGITAVTFAAAWALMAITGWLPVLVLSGILIGLCGAAIFPPISALAVEVFGIEALPKVLGLLGVMMIPFTFLMSPAAGWLRDRFGDYDIAIGAIVSACLLAAFTFFALSRQFNLKRSGENLANSGAPAKSAFN